MCHAKLKFITIAGESRESIQVFDAVNSYLSTLNKNVNASVDKIIFLNERSNKITGKSIKPKNILINWIHIFESTATSIITVSAVLDRSWLAPFAALLLCKELQKLSEIDIGASHAAIISFIWFRSSYKRIKMVPVEQLLNGVNSILENSSLPKLDELKLNDTISELENMGCVKCVAGQVFLIESVIF